MAYRIVLLPLALRRLDGIYEWGVQDSGKRAAQRFVNRIVQKINEIRKSPYVCAVEPMLANLPLGYRGLVAHPYFKVIYHIDEVSAIIYVVDIWDTRMDPEDLQRHINRTLF